MEPLTLYHNPACSKSRGARAMLEEHDARFVVVEYLKTPLDRAALVRLLERLPGAPADLVRRDARFDQLQLRSEDLQTRAAVIDLLLAHPELMQRPVAMRGERAVIARPSEKVLELL